MVQADLVEIIFYSVGSKISTFRQNLTRVSIKCPAFRIHFLWYEVMVRVMNLLEKVLLPFVEVNTT